MNPQLRQWMLFLFGTPKRSLTTFMVLLVITLAIRPELGREFVTRLMIALEPLFMGAFWVIIIGIGFRFLLQSFGSKPKK